MFTHCMPRRLGTIAVALLLALLLSPISSLLPGRAPVAFAGGGSCVWNGGTSVFWMTGSNWKAGCTGPGGIPGPADTVVLYSGAPHDPTVDAKYAAAVASLTVDAGATLTLGSGSSNNYINAAAFKKISEKRLDRLNSYRNSGCSRCCWSLRSTE